LNKHKLQIVVCVVLLTLLVPLFVSAQELTALSSSYGSVPPRVVPNFTQAQLDQLLAPVALYPDPLIGQVLMASTYPLEIVEASRWIQNPTNAALQGDQLAMALEQQSWDPSVQALVSFPQVLGMMNSNLQWTEQLGDAFLAQQAGVMDSVQRLRQQAEVAGNLASTSQQVVSNQGDAIIIEPENPDIVYVPVYNPGVIYGSWSYPNYPPYSIYPPGYVLGATLIGFGSGIIVVESLWGWNYWDWGHHRIDIDVPRFTALNRGYPPLSSNVWQHDPDHRRGVPYRDAVTRARFQGANAPETIRNFRGYGTPPEMPQNHSSASVMQTPKIQSTPEINRDSDHITSEAVRPVNNSVSHEQHPPAAAPIQRPATPIFESFSRGPDVRAQSIRGSTSRASPPQAGSNVSRGAEKASGGNEKGDRAGGSNGGR
jgi:hypothetical protein